MSTFAVRNFESVKSGGRLSFYKLEKDGICQIDEFYDEVCKDKTHEREMTKILAMMNYMAEYDVLLPKEKFRPIEDGGEVAGYEFKNGTLRIYCVKKNPNVVVILGGYKKEQKKDIRKLVATIKEAKSELSEYIMTE